MDTNVLDEDAIVRDITRYYDDHAQTWAEGEQDHSYHPAVAQVCGNLPYAGLMLDLGCGSARATQILLQMGVDRYLGIDRSAGMLEVARKRFGHIRNVEFRQGDIADLSFVGGQGDGFVCAAMLMQIPKPRVPQTLRSIRSAVKADSLGFITTPVGVETVVLDEKNKRSMPPGYRLLLQLWPLDELCRELTSAGFKVVSAYRDEMMGEFIVRAV